MNPAQRIIRVSRVKANESCLVSVTKNGNRPLDVKLVATEGENAFTGIVQHNKIQSLRAKSYKGTDDEWESLLIRSLFHQPISDEHASALESLELVADVASDGTRLTLTWSHKKRTTTHPIASLELEQTEDEPIELLEWIPVAIQAADSADDEVERLNSQLIAANAKITRLEEQLQGLVDEKLAHENALLQKFADLLNSKKLKIRDQQRLLAGAKVDPSTEQQIREARSNGASDSGNVRSQGAKRKAIDPMEESDDSESDAFEDVEMANRQTPEPPDDDTDNEGEPSPPPLPKPAVRHTIGGKKKAIATTESKQASSKSTTSSSKPAPSSTKSTSSSTTAKGDSQAKASESNLKETVDEVPPARSLPFARKSEPAKSELPTQSAGADSNSETDDEL